MSWDEALADRYDRWTAAMTDDIPFYVDLALEADGPSALVYCPFRGLLHVPTWADRRRVFENVAAALAPGGRFAWDAFAFDHRIAAHLDEVRQAEPEPHTMRYSVEPFTPDSREYVFIARKENA